MNYEEFKKQLETELSKISEQGNYSISFDSFLKNNGQKLDGVIIKQQDDSIAPVIYLDHLYNEFLKGRSVPDIARDVFLLAGKGLEKIAKEQVPQMNWDSIKDRLYVTVINAEANEKLLADTPHRRLEDLAIIPKIRVTEDVHGNSSIRVTNQLLGMIEKTKDELLKQAIANTNELPFTCRSIFDVIKGNLGDELEMLDELFCDGNEPPLYVATLPNGLDGASILACRNALDRLTEGFGDEVYVLPSSTDEVLFVPKNPGINLDELKTMVFEVNRTEVPPAKILSDNVYQFERATKKLKIATGEQPNLVDRMTKTKYMTM